jgi:hypothetical protein
MANRSIYRRKFHVKGLCLKSLIRPSFIEIYLEPKNEAEHSEIDQLVSKPNFEIGRIGS